MRRRHVCLIFVSFLFTCSAVVSAAETSPWRILPLIKDGKIADEWVHIGWGQFIVEGDSIKAQPDGRGMGLLIYKPEKLGNCQIRVIYKPLNAKCNSGVYIRLDDGILNWVGKESVAVHRDAKGKLSKEEIAKLQAAAEKEEGVWYAVNHGFEVQIMDDADPLHRTGAIYGLAKADSVPKKKSDDDWRTMIITLRGPSVQIDVDGKRITTFDSETQTPPAKRNWTEPKLDVKRPQVGYIGLQNHDPGDIVSFKEISVRPLE